MCVVVVVVRVVVVVVTRLGPMAPTGEVTTVGAATVVVATADPAVGDVTEVPGVYVGLIKRDSWKLLPPSLKEPVARCKNLKSRLPRLVGQLSRSSASSMAALHVLRGGDAVSAEAKPVPSV